QHALADPRRGQHAGRLDLAPGSGRHARAGRRLLSRLRPRARNPRSKTGGGWETAMDRRRIGLRGAIALSAALAAAPARAQDDTDLFTVAVPPNVLLVVDNSGSMNHIVWHPDFDPSAPTSCNYYSSDLFLSSTTTQTRCGTTRTYYVDPEVPAAGNQMRFDPRYLNWLHSLPNRDPRLTELASTNNGTSSACLQAQGYTTYRRYRRARVTAAKDVLREVICNVNQAGAVRFGIA